MDIPYLGGKNNKSFDLRTIKGKANRKMEKEHGILSSYHSIS